MATNARPRVYVIGTGGSISMVGRRRTDFVNYSYDGKHLTIQELLARVPEVNEFAQVVAEQFLNVGSPEISPAHWLALARRVNEIFRQDPEAAGVAITHGTATLEETAYFLNLTVKDRRPVVVTGSMRPPTGLGTDADVNLLDSVRVAAAAQSAGRGVLTVLNNEIQAARHVTKTNSYRLETFRSNELGLLGYADSDEQVVFYQTPGRTHTQDTEFDVAQVMELPLVDIAYAYAGADGRVVQALAASGSAGIVAAGLGSGGSPRAFMEALKQAQRQGVKVVVATQTGNGRVMRTQRFDEDGYLVADNLSPKKARILLMLALTRTHDQAEIQRMMLTY
ncbi:MAG: asparaginase [Dehalococcoidia bacterium]|nr:asparaginase [Dehalococcoidia bacterium]MSQ16995.1 asparaginase [Dehalococcoidia bacterium]